MIDLPQEGQGKVALPCGPLLPSDPVAGAEQTGLCDFG